MAQVADKLADLVYGLRFTVYGLQIGTVLAEKKAEWLKDLPPIIYKKGITFNK